MKKISNATIDRLKTISPATLVAHGIIKTAPNFRESKQQGYVCPLCNSGGRGNRDSDGAGTFDSNNRFYCHACKNADVGGHKLSTIDLYAIARHLEGESFSEKCRAMAAEFGGGIDYDESNLPRRKRRTKTPPKPPKTPLDPAELELIRADLATSDEPLIKFVESCGGTWRGFTAEFLIKHTLKMKADWTPTKSRVEKKFATPTARILIPAGEDFYTARFCGNLDDYDGSTREFVEKNQKLNAGHTQLFLSKQDVLDSDEPIFAVEGAIDALSIDLAGYPAVALNSRSNGDLLVDELKRRQAEKKKLPLLIVLMDSDEPGRKAAPTLYQSLIDVGCPCCVRFLFDDVTKTDANDILARDGVDNLRERLQSIVDSSRAELDACATELEKREPQLLDDDTLNFLFQGNATDLAFARRLEKFCGSDIRWATDIEKWLIYQRNADGGAVWRRASEKSSVLLPFAQKMTDIMSEYAETSDERKLVEKFQSAKKVTQSITMLKGSESLLITADDLDRHAELLNVRNGVIDLTTGELLNADPSLLLTQQAAAVYNPKCTDKTFADFLTSVMPDEATREAVVRFFGYCLTADVSAEKFLLIYGRGGNGKGVTLLTLRSLLKDYAVELPVDTVLENRGRLTADANGRATTEISPLATRRLGIVDELPRNGRFDVAKVNRLTGRDPIPFRKLYGEFDEIAPTHKLVLTGNYRPQIDDPRDKALLRRLIAVKFEVDFTQNPDTSLKARLQTPAALSGALNVLIPAAVEFYCHGLLEPSSKMKAARNEYLGENDFVGDYLAEYCEFGKTYSVKRTDLLKHMRDNCRDCTLRHRDADLADMIAKIDGVTYHKKRNVWIFDGIRLAPLKKEQSKNEQSDGFVGEPILSSEDY